ncbi:MAG: adenosylcobalamin-dependent ribonucleoside-diphosphate reductase [Oligoflexia bacterium]|nr:adenosylcobalamin-dependent ribonucleoside-diphosphate reductase [Oligoflexia bacterium]
MIKNLFTENALTVLHDRYLWRKSKRNVETPEEMLKRVAKHVAGPSKQLEKRFLLALSELAFLPNSPTLMNAGKKQAQLAACFVLPLADDLTEIMNTLKSTALIHQSGGGTGFSFSSLRPEKSQVQSSNGVAAGPLGFLSLFNELTQTIKQGGLRRGANMGVLSVEHPDIEAFIHCKTDISKITNFNISVAVTNKFINAVKNDSSWNLIDPHTRKKVKTVSASKLFQDICEAAWLTGEPGLIFIDEINKNNPTPKKGIMEATNPCGEQPLLPYEACNLGSINLNVIYQKNNSDSINWSKLSELTETGVLFLDRVIDTCTYPVPEIHDLCHANRKIGLGVMGFADLLLKLNIAYGSPESYVVGEKIMEFIRTQAVLVSQQLAKKHGAFDGFSQSLWNKRGLKPLRNATLTTIAPTGTISLLCNASAGIEPIFSYAYERHVLDKKILREVHPYAEAVLKERGLYNESLLKIMSQEGTFKDASIPDDIKNIFVTTRDLTATQHVEMQARFQKHSDSGVSKTINLSNKASVQDVQVAFMLAAKLKCKGITIYRDGTRPDQVLQLKNCPDCTRI